MRGDDEQRVTNGGGRGHGGFGLSLGHGAHHPDEGSGRRCCEGDGHVRGRGRASLLEPAVLAAVGAEGAHGYDIRGAIERMTDGALCVDPGGLYRVLRRLEEDGLVTSRWEEGEAGPQRRTYRLTEDGKHALGHWADHLRERERAMAAVREAVERAAAGEETSDERP